MEGMSIRQKDFRRGDVDLQWAFVVVGYYINLGLTPPLEAGTKWFDRFDKLTALRPSKGKLTILSKVEGPMGLSKGRSGSSSFWSTTGFEPRGRYN
jgi:hypothetical protein